MTSAHFSTTGRPSVVGHRGASGHALENSLAAFRIAAGDGPLAACDGVELDLQTTADGEFVVHHDAALSTGELIADLPLSRVRATRLADGSPMPTLDEALKVLAGLDVFVEAKQLPAAADARLLATLRRHDRVRSAIHAFDHRIVARLHQLEPSLQLGVLSRSYPVDPVQQVRDAGASALWQEAHLIDEQLVAACHAAGIAVMAWTVNDAAEAQRLSRLGVDGLCGNWPERLRG